MSRLLHRLMCRIGLHQFTRTPFVIGERTGTLYVESLRCEHCDQKAMVDHYYGMGVIQLEE